MTQKGNTMKLSILFYGMWFSFLFAFVVSVLESSIKGNTGGIVWAYLKVGVLLFFFGLLPAKIREEKAVDLERLLLIGNIVALIFSVISTLTTSFKFTGVALGIPSLIAVIYWGTTRNVKTD